MGVLSGQEILRQRELGNIVIDPFDPRFVGVNSVDLHVGDQLFTYSEADRELVEVRQGKMRKGVRAINPFSPPGLVEVPLLKTSRGPAWLLMPGVPYLANTLEKTSTVGFMPEVNNRSTWGRLFVFFHVAAGWGDDGFGEGDPSTWTLEVVATVPTLLYPRSRTIQIRYLTIERAPGEERQSYALRGHYQGQQLPTAPAPLDERGHGISPVLSFNSPLTPVEEK